MVSVALAGGGTAGHTSPLIATAAALTSADPSAKVVAIGTPKGLETRVTPAAGLELELIPPVPLPRKPSVDLLRVPLRLRDAVAKASAILGQRNVEAVVGFGGYVSLPAYLAARRMGLPVIIHEQNAVPGLANKVAARFATRTLVTFPNTPLPNAEVVGMPLRPGLTDLATVGRAARRADAAAALGLDPTRPTLLVSGGSQGARSINNALDAARDRLLAHGVQILHVLGPRNFTDAHQVVTDAATGARYVPVAYVDSMEQAYAAADLMLGRSGAGTVVETAVVGLPTIFVPLPHGNGEQARNADALIAAKAGVLVPDADLTAERLLAEVWPLIGDAERLGTMSRAAQELMPANAADTVASIILDAVAERGTPATPRRVDPGDPHAHS